MAANTEDLRAQSKQRTSEVLNQPGSMTRFAPSPLQQINPALAKSTSFLAPGMQNPFAASMNYQRMPGAQYANYERAAPNVGGPLQAPQVPAGFVPPGTQPEVLPNPNAPIQDPTPTDSPTTEDEILAQVNEFREGQGQEPFESYDDFLADLNINIGHIGLAADGGYVENGGISSLQPQGFEIGGEAKGNIFSRMAGGIGDLVSKGIKNYQENTGIGLDNEKKSDKPLEQMSREELIALLKGNSKKPMGTSPDAGGFKTDELVPLGQGMYEGGLMALANGGPVYYPRMNGQISGPGTERSDDIPAMLSDGEFVVNAKALRGIGKLDGANGSKKEQRQKGARMMYAMQKAGEQAMRNS